MVRLHRQGNSYYYDNYDIEQFEGRWYVFDGAEWVADFATLLEVRAWLSDLELIGE